MPRFFFHAPMFKLTLTASPLLVPHRLAREKVYSPGSLSQRPPRPNLSLFLIFIPRPVDGSTEHSPKALGRRERGMLALQIMIRSSGLSKPYVLLDLHGYTYWSAHTTVSWTLDLLSAWLEKNTPRLSWKKKEKGEILWMLAPLVKWLEQLRSEYLRAYVHEVGGTRQSEVGVYRTNNLSWWSSADWLFCPQISS